MDIIYDTLIAYSQTNAYPFHMPGHKRRLSGDVLGDVSRIDITEIDGFDNLHDPQGMLKEAQQRAAKLYGAEESFFLINGSTCGILSAVAACVPNGGWLMMARNCHKSAYHAVLLGNLKTVYLYPETKPGFSFCSGLHLKQVQKAVDVFDREHPQEKIGAVVITSPTYEGVVSDVEEITEFLHQRGIPLIVDEAHGAHFGLAENLPQNSCKYGADIVIHSLHKTLPAMTQTALLHVNGTLVERRRLRRYLSVYQTSSPSYVLMASMDRALTMMAENGEEYFKEFLARRQKMMEALRQCRRICIYDAPDGDPCKLVISVRGSGWTGKQLYDALRTEYELQPEMAAGDYVVAILTVMDTEEGLNRLTDALLELDQRIEQAAHQEEDIPGGSAAGQSLFLQPEVSYTIGTALDLPHEFIRFEQAEGRISGDFVYVYPPGIPLLAPGEVITRKHILQLNRIRELKLDLKGIQEDGTLEVVFSKSILE